MLPETMTLDSGCLYLVCSLWFAFAWVQVVCKKVKPLKEVYFCSLFLKFSRYLSTESRICPHSFWVIFLGVRLKAAVCWNEIAVRIFGKMWYQQSLMLVWCASGLWCKLLIEEIASLDAVTASYWGSASCCCWGEGPTAHREKSDSTHNAKRGRI